jgi:hypothetical protein
MMKPFSPDDLENLDRYHCLVKMQSSGNTMPAIEITTQPLQSLRERKGQEEVLEQIRKQTRERFCKSRAEVEAYFGQIEAPPTEYQEGSDVDED